MHWWQFKGWDWGRGGGGHQFFSEKHFCFMKIHTNVKHYEMKCKAQEPQLWMAYFWSYCPLNIENYLHGNIDFHLAICVEQ